MKKISTIKELNSKGWYRFVKVIYITSLILCLLILVVVAVVNMPKKIVNVEDSIITCTARDNIQYYLSALEKYDFKYSERSDVLGGNLLSANRHCNGVYYALHPEEDTGLTEEQILRAREIGEEWRRTKGLGIVETKVEKDIFLDETDRYSINYTTYTKPSIVDYILIVSGSLVGILIGFELIRRIFYYITLGKIKPTKE